MSEFGFKNGNTNSMVLCAARKWVEGWNMAVGQSPIDFKMSHHWKYVINHVASNYCAESNRFRENFKLKFARS